MAKLSYESGISFIFKTENSPNEQQSSQLAKIIIRNPNQKLKDARIKVQVGEGITIRDSISDESIDIFFG